ncbi:MAG TPA: TlpA disulfide reductase family protein [Bacteroidia bacterium]|nr:TlpA disulfide reductase family protein [Bacteroidia bacterium]
MRTGFVILFLLFFGLSETGAQSTFSLNGKIADAKEKSVQMLINRSYLLYKPEVTTVPLQGGQFSFTLNLDRNRIVELIYSGLRMPIYAVPGKDLNVEFADAIPVQMQINGSVAEDNGLLQKFFTQFQSDFNDSIVQVRALASTPDAFEMEAFKQRKAQLEYIKSSAQKDLCSPDFIAFLQDQATYHYWRQLFAFPILNANNNKSILTVNPLPGVMLEGLDKLNVNNEKALICDSYREFLKYYVTYFASKTNGFNKFQDPSTSADRKQAIAREKLSGTVFAYWEARFISDECERLSPFIVKKMVTELKENDPANVFTPAVKAHCDGRTGNAIAAQPDQKSEKKETASAKNDELDLTDVNGKTVQLSDFKGKVVYIDFWASWCGPCRGMMPFSKQLHEQLTDKEKKQIVFLYISIDANKDAWLKGIKDMDIQGVNEISPGNWSSMACRYFQINSIPRYMIMNKKGDIVNFNAPRPVDPALIGELRKLVGE